MIVMVVACSTHFHPPPREKQIRNRSETCEIVGVKIQSNTVSYFVLNVKVTSPKTTSGDGEAQHLSLFPFHHLNMVHTLIVNLSNTVKHYILIWFMII